jgi:hypothetical protein
LALGNDALIVYLDIRQKVQGCGTAGPLNQGSTDLDPCGLTVFTQHAQVKITKRKARLEWDWKKPRIEARRRMFAENTETKALYRQRAGGESAFSVAKRKLGLNRLRRRGQENATLSIFLVATALEVLRMHSWLVWCPFSLQFSKISSLLMCFRGLEFSFFPNRANRMKMFRHKTQTCFC